MNPKICVLETRTFVGAAPGASHYFGSLWCNENSHDLTHELSHTRARAMNKSQYLGEYDAGGESGGFVWEAGMECNSYFSLEEVIAAGKEKWKEVFPEARILLTGPAWAHSVCDPQEPLAFSDAWAGAEYVFRKLTELFESANQVDFWDGCKENVAAMKLIAKEWDKVISEHLGSD